MCKVPEVRVSAELTFSPVLWFIKMNAMYLWRHGICLLLLAWYEMLTKPIVILGYCNNLSIMVPTGPNVTVFDFRDVIYELVCHCGGSCKNCIIIRSFWWLREHSSIRTYTNTAEMQCINEFLNESGTILYWTLTATFMSPRWFYLFFYSVNMSLIIVFLGNKMFRFIVNIEQLSLSIHNIS